MNIQQMNEELLQQGRDFERQQNFLRRQAILKLKDAGTISADRCREELLGIGRDQELIDDYTTGKIELVEFKAEMLDLGIDLDLPDNTALINEIGAKRAENVPVNSVNPGTTAKKAKTDGK